MAARETLTASIPTELASALREAVSAGEYASLDEAFADALTAWARRHEDQEEAAAWIRARIRASIADPRPSLSPAEVRAHMKKVSARSRATDDEAA